MKTVVLSFPQSEGIQRRLQGLVELSKQRGVAVSILDY
jgi:hypothetical protein